MDQVSIVWFRRDLRVTHHAALNAAFEHAPGAVLALYVVDPAFSHAGHARQAALAAALRRLDGELGGRLVVRYGDPAVVVPRVAAAVGAAHVFVTRDHGPYGRRRDAAVAEALRAAGRTLVGRGANYLVAPGTVVTGAGSPYAVFTPFFRRWRACLPAATHWEVPDLGRLATADTEPLPGSPADVGPDAALSTPDADLSAAWASFRDRRLADYDTARDRPDLPGTSRMSVELRWGTVHPGELSEDLVLHAPGTERYLAELAWREFFADVLYHRPAAAWANLRAAFDRLPVDTGTDARLSLQRWATGTTGFPLVDAGMRQLLATGWMHNRVRMVVASFLVKDLHLPWQWGARHFMAHLCDGDLASNQLGWQWCAGSGPDAAPYYRIFNPTAQAERYDPDGDYIRRWVPELAHLAAPSIHAPGTARPSGYPAPMVDHAEARAEALARYAQIKTPRG